jgi:lactoylglutathione lyase
MYTKDLEQLCRFYEHYFNCKCSDKYENVEKGFESYFLTFDSGSQIEIMRKESIDGALSPDGNEKNGLTHLAISVGSEIRVDELTSKLEQDGYKVISNPRITGDGFYESVVLDPDGNRIELTI